MIDGFRQFIARRNVLDLAVAVIIGAAFATITPSLTEGILMRSPSTTCCSATLAIP